MRRSPPLEIEFRIRSQSVGAIYIGCAGGQSFSMRQTYSMGTLRGVSEGHWKPSHCNMLEGMSANERTSLQKTNATDRHTQRKESSIGNFNLRS
jgi:hypothetical protein